MPKRKDSRARDITDFSFLVALADADFLDEFELQVLKNLALEDAVIDETEKAVLRNIFDRLSKHQMSSETWQDIKKFRNQYRI